ncbi:23S rRNA (adenine(2030)-N(6))-methyltransferase RlmJ [Teredinibacter turnerae]|uniref:23S rRNA (adenine(2030)-N(6))-methyltransferase RlmJ n=1 Tax=Teredinibacter turnerae TaxID=2426 RepID=UPI00036507A9|nr:23S rRNA (adenine(2030)-N(6))-methyltransferase RlmJ [Teredinibacter turnerae]
MLSYRHAFHAGNHADVLKHLCLSMVLEKLIEKDKPLTYLETHAAAGAYDLNTAMPQKNREYMSGISPLLASEVSSEAMSRYKALVARYFADYKYPGSPAVAASVLREQDKLVLMELHNTEFEILRNNMRRDKRVTLHHRDGIEGVLALSPPTPRRGIVLIDPPYEQPLEYERIAKLIAQLHRKWPVGVIALWYPLLAQERNRAPAMLDVIARSQPASLFTAELWVEAQASDYGMYGSGMAFINLPWTVDEKIALVLPEIQQILAPDQGGFSHRWVLSPN